MTEKLKLNFNKVHDDIKQRAIAAWPADKTMQQFCIEAEEEALQQLRKLKFGALDS